MSVLRDEALQSLVDRLHAQSDNQVAAIEAFQAGRPGETELKAFRSDKLVALDRDKAEFCYQLCRAIDARLVVEAGTSYGVSTLYLAAAVRDNVRASGGAGRVIATEYEPDKARVARGNFESAGLSDFIELREGDLRDTLRHVDGTVDFMLVDIWVPMARPALALTAPRLRRGAIVVCDNTAIHREAYAEYFSFLADPANRFRTMTLPYSGGLEMSVRCG